MTNPIETAHGLVAYTDGGCRPNPGFGGWGMHGYTYSSELPKKGAGHPSHILTNLGYLPKSSASVKKNTSIDDLICKNNEDATAVQVKPLEYIDAYGAFHYTVTNNQCELAAAVAASELAVTKQVKDLLIISDSAQVVNGATKWLSSWKQNNWMTSTGTPVASQWLWKKLDDNLSKLYANGSRVAFQWIKGHDGHEGNTQADVLATIGVFYAQSKYMDINGTPLSTTALERTDTKVYEDLTPAEGYWKSEVDVSPLICLPRMYFVNAPDTRKRGEYFLGNHGKDDDLLGKRSPDGAYAFVALTTPNPALEALIARQNADATHYGVTIMARLDVVFSPDFYRSFMKHAGLTLVRTRTKHQDLSYLGTEPVTKELSPPQISQRALEAVNALKGMLEAFLNDRAAFSTTNLTEVFYETNKKGSLQLKPEYVVGFAKQQTLLNVSHLGQPKQVKAEQTLGVDLPTRNHLKRLESLNPKITSITWVEGEQMFRHANIIECSDGVGIFAGWYSNTYLIDPIQKA